MNKVHIKAEIENQNTENIDKEDIKSIIINSSKDFQIYFKPQEGIPLFSILTWKV